jgi:hypothetical protein
MDHCCFANRCGTVRPGIVRSAIRTVSLFRVRDVVHVGKDARALRREVLIMRSESNVPDIANVRRLAHDARYARDDESAAAAIGFLSTAVEGLCDIVEALTTDYVDNLVRDKRNIVELSTRIDRLIE